MDVQFSGNWQGYPGVPLGVTPQERGSSLNVNYIVDRTIVPNLTQASVTVPLIPPGAKYLKRWNQIDIRFAKRLHVRGVRVQGQFDIFNLMNASSILDTVQTFGSRLDRPTGILQGRLFAVGAQLNF